MFGGVVATESGWGGIVPAILKKTAQLLMSAFYSIIVGKSCHLKGLPHKKL